jgi:hypothetical protein
MDALSVREVGFWATEPAQATPSRLWPRAAPWPPLEAGRVPPRSAVVAYLLLSGAIESHELA